MSLQKDIGATINIGIESAALKHIAQALSHVLANTYTLYLKTHNFHWNVTGPLFNTLHLMFEQQYMELAQAADTIAERIRAVGFFAPGSYTEFAALSSIPEASTVPDAQEMIRQLIEGHEAVARAARDAFSIADDVKDESTADLLTQRLQIHEKTAWMLRASLNK